MAYAKEYHPQVKKDIKRLDKQVVDKIHDVCIPEIVNNPQSGSPLTGNLSGVRSYHFGCNGVQYRIAYLVNDQIVTILFLAISKRENFYELLKNRM